MKIAIIGTTGFVVSAILNELAGHNHEITAIARNPKNDGIAAIKWKKADINNVEELSKIIAGNDVIVDAFSAGWTNPNLYTNFLDGSKAIQVAVKKIRGKTIYYHWRWRKFVCCS